ncbi:TetR family transcriptional regulator [Gordonia sp. SID5947]|uniref:TetR/AcrR family transcriptional regulator n=1 Tax=Gordonia sp. SID5947 TaxID=2690315 RepID=UPI00136EA591|nr:TetR/AcrR family transcriptional regulator C-terminal domain-containing protein [Gordonia sp. SID5947]MYR07166.1 TetR family transcriptional regulator [Gordonia sp. SID5947]
MPETTDRPEFGSPDWWRESPPETAEAHRTAGGRPPMPLDEILTEALALLAAGGIEGLGMRALARRLGSSTSTLYRQLPGGLEELCTRLAERVMRDAVSDIAAADLGDDWSSVVEGSAIIAFDTLRRNPHSAALFAGQIYFGPMGLLRYEESLRLLLAAGLSPTRAAAADHALARLIVGYALQESHDAAPGRATITEYYRRLDADRFPSVATVLPALPEDLRAEFVFALRTFVAGLRQLAAEAAGGSEVDEQGSAPR